MMASVNRQLIIDTPHYQRRNAGKYLGVSDTLIDEKIFPISDVVCWYGNYHSANDYIVRENDRAKRKVDEWLSHPFADFQIHWIGLHIWKGADGGDSLASDRNIHSGRSADILNRELDFNTTVAVNGIEGQRPRDFGVNYFDPRPLTVDQCLFCYFGRLRCGISCNASNLNLDCASCRKPFGGFASLIHQVTSYEYKPHGNEGKQSFSRLKGEERYLWSFVTSLSCLILGWLVW